MNEHVLQILDELKSRDFFNNSNINLTINYQKILPDYKDVLFNEDSYQIAKTTINNHVIESYNLTIKHDSGIDFNIPEYKYGWKSVNYTFFGGSSKKEDHLPAGCGAFNFRLLGSIGEIDTYRNEKGVHIYKYTNLSKLVDTLVEFEKILDKQFKERAEIYDKLKSLQ